MILFEKCLKKALTYIAIVFLGHFQQVNAIDLSEIATDSSGSEYSCKLGNSSGIESPLTSPRTKKEEGVVIKIGSRQDITNFIASDADLKKVQQIIASDLNKENSISLMSYLNLNSKSLLNLKKLTLKNLPFDQENASNLAEILNNTKNLKELRIESNQMSGNGFKKLKIKNKLSLQKLEIINNNLDEATIKNLKPLFTKSDNLKFLSLKGSSLADFNLANFEDIVKLLSTLIYLDISSTKIDAIRLEAILSKTSNLKHLNLSDNDFGNITVSNTNKIQGVFRNLEVLILSNSMIDASLTYTLVNLISNNGSLKTLDLSNNNIGNQGVHLIALNFANFLEKLIIKNNGINKSSLLYLKNSINNFKKLTTLDISENNLTGGIDELKDIVSHRHFTLRVLNISKTNLGDSDLKLLAKHFDIFNSLNNLYLEYNNFTKNGYDHLLKISNIKTNIKLLTIHSHVIPKNTLEVISDILSNKLQGCKIIHIGFVGQI